MSLPDIWLGVLIGAFGTLVVTFVIVAFIAIMNARVKVTETERK